MSKDSNAVVCRYFTQRAAADRERTSELATRSGQRPLYSLFCFKVKEMSGEESMLVSQSVQVLEGSTRAENSIVSA